MNVKSFQINGFQVEIRAEKLPGKMVRITLHMEGDKIDNVEPEIPEAELEETAERLKRLMIKRLSF